MVRESLVSSVGAGFGLVRREFGSVLIWGLIAVVLAAVPYLVGFAFMGPAIFSASLEAEPNMDAFGALMAGQMLQSSLATLFSILGAAVITPAIYRAALLPRSERGFFWLRFGKIELFMGLFHVIMAVLFFVAFFIAFLLLVVLIGLPLGGLAAFGANSGGGAAAGAAVGIALLMIPLGIGLLLAVLYLIGRLWPASVMIVADQELRIFDGWAYTRGLGWRLVGMQVVLVLICIAMAIGFFAVFGAIAGVGGLGITNLFLSPQSFVSGLGTVAALVIGLAIAYFFFVAVLQAIWIAPWARAYEIIAMATGRSKQFGPASVF